MRKYFNCFFFTSMVAFHLQTETFIHCKSKVNMSPYASERVTCKFFLSVLYMLSPLWLNYSLIFSMHGLFFYNYLWGIFGRWQDKSHWKGPHKVSSSNFCSTQGQLWEQTRFLRALFDLVLKTSKEDDGKTSLGTLFYCLVTFMTKMFFIPSPKLFCFFQVISIVSHPVPSSKEPGSIFLITFSRNIPYLNTVFFSFRLKKKPRSQGFSDVPLGYRDRKSVV